MNGHSAPQTRRYPDWLYVLMALAGLAILVFVGWVAISPDVARDAFGSYLVRALLGVAVSLVGMFLIGKISFNTKIAGVPIEAGGGVALGFLFFYFSPSLVGEPAFEKPIAKPKQPQMIDFRSGDETNGFRDADQRDGELYVIVDLGLTNISEPSRTLTWDGTSAVLEVGDRSIPLRQFSFTFIENDQDWLGERESARPLPVAPGDSVAKEVIFTPQSGGQSGMNWGNFLNLLDEQEFKSPVLEIKYVTSWGTETNELSLKCTAEVARWAENIDMAKSAETRHHPRLTTYCEEGSRDET